MDLAQYLDICRHNLDIERPTHTNLTRFIAQVIDDALEPTVRVPLPRASLNLPRLAVPLLAKAVALGCGPKVRKTHQFLLIVSGSTVKHFLHTRLNWPARHPYDMSLSLLYICSVTKKKQQLSD